MIDATTQQPLRIFTNGAAQPQIRVLTSQLDEIKRVLDQYTVRYSVSELAISINGGPERTVVTFGNEADVARIQAIFDRM